MKNSEKFIKSLKDYKKQSRGLLIGLLCFLSAISISLLLNYKASFSNKLLPFLYIGGIIIVTIIIIIVILKYPDYCKLTDEEKKQYQMNLIISSKEAFLNMAYTLQKII